jgi:putative transposase
MWKRTVCTSLQDTEGLSYVVKIDEVKVSGHLGDLVREKAEETLNGILDAETQVIRNAQRYERMTARKDFRAGVYWHNLPTLAEQVKLDAPRL